MSVKEQCISILDTFSESQLINILTMLKATHNAVSEAEDDAFCNALFEKYLNEKDDSDPIPIEDFAKELGIEL